MWLLFFCMLTGFSPESHILPLQIPVSAVGCPDFDAKSAQIAADGTVLLASRKVLYHLDHKGALIRTIDQASGHPFQAIATHFYDPKRELYWIIDGRDRKSHFYDGSGQWLGLGYERTEAGLINRNVYFRQLIPVGRRVFALDTTQLDTWMSELPQALQLLEFERTVEGIEIHRRGPAVGRFSDMMRKYHFDFKQHWMVQRGFSQDFLVVNELADVITPFATRPGADISAGLVARANEFPLPMRERVPPPPPETKRRLDSVASTLGWLHSFTRITGLYSLGEHLVLGYSVPSRSRNQISLLGLQKIDWRGKAWGNVVLMEGELIGASGDWACVLERKIMGGCERYYLVWVRL